MLVLFLLLVVVDDDDVLLIGDSAPGRFIKLCVNESSSKGSLLSSFRKSSSVFSC